MKKEKKAKKIPLNEKSKKEMEYLKPQKFAPLKWSRGDQERVKPQNGDKTNPKRSQNKTSLSLNNDTNKNIIKKQLLNTTLIPIGGYKTNKMGVNYSTFLTWDELQTRPKIP